MRLLRVLASALALAACAPEIVRQPTQLTSVTEQAGGTIEILEDTIAAPARGLMPRFQRMRELAARWGGEQNADRLFEAFYLLDEAVLHLDLFAFNADVGGLPNNVDSTVVVLDGDRVVGFYLPVERAFSPAPGGPGTRLSIRRREP